MVRGLAALCRFALRFVALFLLAVFLLAVGFLPIFLLSLFTFLSLLTPVRRFLLDMRLLLGVLVAIVVRQAGPRRAKRHADDRRHENPPHTSILTGKRRECGQSDATPLP
jgi:hypothetical protein